MLWTSISSMYFFYCGREAAAISNPNWKKCLTTKKSGQDFRGSSTRSASRYLFRGISYPPALVNSALLWWIPKTKFEIGEK